VVDLLERRPFVGRERELSRLLGLLDAAAAGDGRTAFLAGEAGIGKSRLLARLDEEAAGRARTETGACLPLGAGALPYAPFVEILRHVVGSVDPATLPALLGPGRGVLTRLLPEIARRESELADAASDDPTAQGRLFELILGVLRRLAAERPLILGIEDLQWADRSTRELLAFLVRTLRDDPVLIVITLRTGEETESRGTLELIAELERDDGVERIDLQPFGRAEIVRQVEALLDRPMERQEVDGLVARSDGNPFFVEELVLAESTGRGAVPSVIRDVLAARVGTLHQRARDVLRAATIGGREIDEELLGQSLHLDRSTVTDALREAIADGILVRGADGAGAPVFRHALLREAFERELFPTERAALHSAYAEALVRRIADGRGTVTAAELARHWDEAGEPGRALRPMIEAARMEEAVYAWPEALVHWERALALFDDVPDAPSIAGMDRSELDGRAADCALLAGEYATAIGLGRAAIDRVDARADPALAGALHNRLRWYLWESGDRRGAAEAIEAALRLIPQTPPSRDRAQALAQHAGMLLFAGAYEASIAEARAALDMATSLDLPGEIALARGVLGWGLAAIGDIDGGLREFKAGRAIAESFPSSEGVAVAALNLSKLLDQVGRSEEQLETARTDAMEMDRRGLSRTYGALLRGYQAKAELVLGRWDEVERTTSDGLRAGPSDRGELWLGINRARLLVGRGQVDAARSQLERARVLERRLGGTEFAGPLLLAEAELAVVTGDVAALRRAGAAGIELAQSGGAVDTSLAWLAILVVRGEADALDPLRGSDRAAAARAEVLARLAAVEGAVRSVLSARPEASSGPRSGAIRAQLAAEESRLAGVPQPAAWAAVADAWATVGRPHAVSYARFRQAEATVEARGDRSEAAAVLARARATSVALGAAPLTRRIDDLARAARIPLDGYGSAPPETSSADPYGFTPRERQVLALVSDGRSNQEIAEHLFITRKTASVHVSNLMAKLGAANRGEVAAMAHRLGLVEPSL